jgi:two-component system sensor histidine kinase TctE
MIGQIELLRQEPGAAAFEQYLSGLSASAKHVAHAVNQLLTLSRTDPSLLQVREFVTIDLDAMVQQVVGSFIDRSIEFGLDLGAEVQLAKVRGNARLLGDLLSNLVDNALNYTPRGGRITVRTGLIDAAPYLEVEDNGPGIPESERSMVKRRFYRSPGSPGTGSGLGLAIVEDIARLHDAVVSIEAGQGDCGTRIRVLFVAPTQP